MTAGVAETIGEGANQALSHVGEGWVRVSELSGGTLGCASLPLTPTLSPLGRGSQSMTWLGPRFGLQL